MITSEPLRLILPKYHSFCKRRMASVKDKWFILWQTNIHTSHTSTWHYHSHPSKIYSSFFRRKHSNIPTGEY